MRNIFQPTRSLYHFRLKSDGPLCDFHKIGDLDLDHYPILTKQKTSGPSLNTSAVKKIRTIRPAVWSVHPSKTDTQTDRHTNLQTNRQTAVTNQLNDDDDDRRDTQLQTTRLAIL